jgi:hypothetical protein
LKNWRVGQRVFSNVVTVRRLDYLDPHFLVSSLATWARLRSSLISRIPRSVKFKDLMNSISFSHVLSVAVDLRDDGIRPLVVAAEAGVVVVVVVA